MSSTITMEAVTQGPLMRLPPELRLVIYEHSLPPTQVVLQIIEGNLRAQKRPLGLARYSGVGILATCRTLYNESKPVLYNNTEFCFVVRDHEAVPGSAWEERDQERVLAKALARTSPSAMPMANIRKLHLEVALSKSAAVSKSAASRRAAWTEVLKYHLRAAENLQSLHIGLTNRGERRFDQEQTDETLRIIGETVRCNGLVTANLVTQLAFMNFKQTGYHRMLASYGGTDKTNEIIEEEIRDRERIRVFVESNDEFLEFTSHKERIRVTRQRSDTIDSTHLWRIERFEYQQRVATMEDLRSRFVNLRQNIAQLKGQRDDLNKEREASLREMEDAEVDGTMI